jgi:hypothetical protein
MKKQIIPLLLWDLFVFIIAAVVILMSKKPLEVFFEESPGYLVLFMLLFFSGTPIIFFLIPATLGKAHKQFLMTNGVAANATVMEVTTTGVIVMSKPIKKITLKVTPPVGEVFEAYIEERTTASTILPKVGDTVSVRYNPNAPNDIMIIGMEKIV